MDIPEDDVLRLVGMVYEAALDERKWPSFLQAFARAVGGNSAFLRAANLQTGTTEFVADAGYDPAWREAYCNHFIKLDYLTPAVSQLRLCEAKTGEQVLSLPEQRKTEYFNDYMLPQDKVYAIGSLLSNDNSHMLMLAAQRGERAGAFGDEQTRLMNILAPHVARAVQVHRKIGRAVAEKEWTLGALDHLRMGVILTGISGKPLSVNRAAEQMLAAGCGISFQQGRLALSTLPETARLYRLIAEASRGAPGTNRGGDMRVALPGGEFMHCLVMPIPQEFSACRDFSPASGCVAVFLSRPGGLQLPPKRLAALYGFTPAEARLAAKLSALRNIEQAAEELCITVHTARSQLKSVFAKSGAKSQPELLMLLATGVLAYCREE